MRIAGHISTVAIGLLTVCCYADAGMMPGIAGPIVLPMFVDGDDRGAIEWWNEHTPLDFFEAGEAPGEQEIGWVYVRDGALPFGVRGQAEVYWSRETGEVLRCEVTLDDDAPEVVRHELGHCLGLDHDPFSESIMHSPVQPYGDVTAHDVECVLHGCPDE